MNKDHFMLTMMKVYGMLKMTGSLEPGLHIVTSGITSWQVRDQSDYNQVRATFPVNRSSQASSKFQ
jgi:hypothetical protein